MNQEFWNSIESKYPLGKLIYGKIEFHSPVGAVVIGYTKDDRKQVWLSVKQACFTKIPGQVKNSCGKSIMTLPGSYLRSQFVQTDTYI